MLFRLHVIASTLEGTKTGLKNADLCTYQKEIHVIAYLAWWVGHVKTEISQVSTDQWAERIPQHQLRNDTTYFHSLVPLERYLSSTKRSKVCELCHCRVRYLWVKDIGKRMEGMREAVCRAVGGMAFKMTTWWSSTNLYHGERSVYSHTRLCVCTPVCVCVCTCVCVCVMIWEWAGCTPTCTHNI